MMWLTSTFRSKSTRTGREVGVAAEEELGLLENRPSFEPELRIWSRSLPVPALVSETKLWAVQAMAFGRRLLDVSSQFGPSNVTLAREDVN